MGNGSSISDSHKAPQWIYTVRCYPQFYKDGFGRISPGCKSIALNTIVRHRKGCSETDGAIWSKGFSTGKHVFEIVFPVKVRAPYASIGIGTKNSELHAKKPMSLVGQANYSWGIDLASKKVFSNGLLVGKFPDSIFSKIPDRFYMYLDLVNFRLMFGSDGKYFGVALEDETMKNFALYPMVSLTREGAAVTMVYRGVGRTVKGPIRKKKGTKKGEAKYKHVKHKEEFRT